MGKSYLLKRGSIFSLAIALITSQVILSGQAISASAEEGRTYYEAKEQFKTSRDNKQSNDIALLENTVEVSTWEELQGALSDPAVSDISLVNDITLQGTETVVGTKSITGNMYSLFSNGYNLTMQTDSNLTLINIDINNTSSSLITSIDSEQSLGTVTIQDVTAEGPLFDGVGEVTFAEFFISNTGIGRVNTINIQEDAFMEIHNIDHAGTTETALQVNQLTVSENAEIYISSQGVGIYQEQDNQSLINNGSITIKSGDIAIYGSDSTITLNSGSDMTITGGNGTNGAIGSYTTGGPNITAKSGSSFEISSNSTLSTVGTSGELNLEEGSNFSITNYNAAGTPLGVSSDSTVVSIASSEGLQMWEQGASDFSVAPITTYSGPLTTSFTLIGNSDTQQTNLISNNASFQQDFKSNEIGKIIGGNFAQFSPIAKTLMDDLTTITTNVTGTAEPESTVTIRNGSTTIGTGLADSTDGRYDITIVPQLKDSIISATASSGNVVSNTATVIVQEGTIADTTIHSLMTNSNSVTGTAEPESTVTILSGSAIIGTGSADDQGNYMITIPTQLAGITVTAQAEHNGILSNIASTVVMKAPTVGTISPAPYRTNDMYITGVYTGDVVRANLLVNNHSVSWGGTFTNGSFTYFARNANITALDEVVLVAYDEDHNELDRQVVVIIGTEGTISPDAFRSGDRDITGTYTGDVVRARLSVNGDVISWGGTFEDGRFRYYVPAGTIGVGDSVVLTAFDVNNVELDWQTVSITGTQGTITPNEFPVVNSNSAIAGTYTGDVVQARLTVNGKSVSRGGDFENGTFNYYVPAGVIEVGDDVVLTAFDEDGRELDRQKVMLIAIIGTIDPEIFQVLNSNSTITGAYTGSVARARLIVNGDVVSTGGTFADGNFSYFVRAGTINVGDNVTLTAYSADGQELDSQTVQVIATQGTITPDPFHLAQGNTNITGSYTGDVTQIRLVVNERTVSHGGTFNPNGTFMYFVRGGDIILGDKVLLIALDSTGRELDRKTVSTLNM